MKSIIPICLVVSAAIISNVFGAGVAVFKDQSFHADSSAYPIAYVQISVGGPVIQINTGRQNMTVDGSKFVSKIEVQSVMPPAIVDASGIKPVRQELDDLKAFAIRYPKSAPLLQPNISALSKHVAKFDAGEIRYDGAWISKESYAVIVAKQKEQTEVCRKQDLARAEETSKLPSVTLADGTILKGCKAVKKEATMVSVMHSDGVRKIKLSELSDATKKALDLESVPLSVAPAAPPSAPTPAPTPEASTNESTAIPQDGLTEAEKMGWC